MASRCIVLLFVLLLVFCWHSKKTSCEGFDASTSTTLTNTNFLFADKSGNLTTAVSPSTIGFVGNGAQFSGNAVPINTPDGTTRINNSGIMFGGANTGTRETNSASISAGVVTADSLSIVGMSDGTGALSTRKINMYAEGGATLKGPLTVDSLRIGTWKLTSDASNNLVLTQDSSTTTPITISPAGKINVPGGMYVGVAASSTDYTIWPHSTGLIFYPGTTTQYSDTKRMKMLRGISKQWDFG